MAEDLKDPGTDLTAVDMSDIQGVAERPKSIAQDDLAGTEGIGVDDIRLPRLSIAQGLSYEMIPDDSRYIQGLTLFDMFNDLTGMIYGRGPLTFVPVRRDVRYIEYAPREEGGGVLDLNVPPNDPRTKWTVEDGERIPPKATKYSEFVILLVRKGHAIEPIVISIKDTNKFNRRAAEQLTSFIKLRHAPIYSGMYHVTSKPEKNDSGTFGVPVMKNAGFIPKDDGAGGTALYNYAKNFAESLEGKQIVVEREAGDPTDFDTATYDGEAAGKTTDM